jgi:hypothetical protein
MNRYLMVGVIGVLSLGALSACGSDDTSTVDEVLEANSSFCTDLAEYASSIEAFVALDPTVATKSDVESAADDVESARENLSSSATDLAEAEWDNLEAQAEELKTSLDDAADDETVTEIVADLQTKATEVRASVAALDTAVCDSTATTEG